MKKQIVLSALAAILTTMLLLASVFLIYNFIFSSIDLLTGKTANSFLSGGIAIR